MRILAAVIVPLAVIGSSAQAQETITMLAKSSMLSREDVQTVAPALDRYTQERLLGDVWKRPGLNGRDRGIVTVAALIARNQPQEMPFYLNLALDSGVKARELSEIITHLAFYTVLGQRDVTVPGMPRKEVFSRAQQHRDWIELPAYAACPIPPPSTKRRKLTELRALAVNSARPSRAWCRTPPTYCSAICGCAPISHRGIAV